MKSKYSKIIKKYEKLLHKKYLILVKKALIARKKFNLLYKKINWHKVSFSAVIIFIFIAFLGFWRYNLISAKAFIKIFPKTAEGNFRNLNEILTLDNTETSNINSFNKNNSAFPFDFMQENIYSFEINLKPEDQTIVLPSNVKEGSTESTTTTSTTLGSTEIVNETTTTIETTTTTIPPDTSTTTISTTTTTSGSEATTIPTTTTLAPETTTTTIGEQVSKIKIIKPLLSFLNNNFKNISLLGYISELASDVLEKVEQQKQGAIGGEVTLTGFVLPELLEDEVLTQFSDKEQDHDILNAKLGLSFANKHFSKDTDTNLTIEIFGSNGWEKIETIRLNEEISNGRTGSYYYIGLGNIDSVQDIEELKVRLTYYSSNSNDQDRIYIDSAWVEVAINSDLEAIINDNASEVDNKLFTKMEEFYNFDQEVVITIPKEQSKIKKIYKTDITIGDNIIETNNKTMILDPTTVTIESGSSGGSGTPEETIKESENEQSTDTTIANDNNSSSPDSETKSDSTPDTSSNNEVTPTAESSSAPVENLPSESAPSESSDITPAPAAPSNDSAPSSSEGPTSWLRKTINFVNNFSKRLIASVTDLIDIEETNDTTTSTSESTTTTEITITTTTTEITTTSITTTTSEPKIEDIVPTSETTVTTTNTKETTPEDINDTINSNFDNQYQVKEDNSLVLREELVPMNDFQIRSAVLLTPNRRAYRNNISISETDTDYIITIKHGPKLLPGNYRLMIKYKDDSEFYRHIVDFVWGGEILKDIQIQENIWCYFVKDNEDNQQIYIQINSDENYYYTLNIREVKANADNPIGFIENNFFFIDENGNMQGFDINSNSSFSKVLENDRPNFFEFNNKKYLITIANGIISFTKQND